MKELKCYTLKENGDIIEDPNGEWMKRCDIPIDLNKTFKDMRRYLDEFKCAEHCEMTGELVDGYGFSIKLFPPKEWAAYKKKRWPEEG